MAMRQLKIFEVLFLCFSVLLEACGPVSRSNVKAALDEVESYINDRPDSALAVLRGLDSTAVIRRPAQRARAALLHSIALDKCYIDLHTDSILAPAVAWYRRHGTPDERLKMLYYLGRIRQNEGDLESAAGILGEAEEYIPEATDLRQVGLLALAQATLSRQTYNTDREIAYIESGQRFFKETGDTLYTRRGNARLAMAYQRNGDWEIADSLYRIGLVEASGDSLMTPVFLSDYARLKVLQPDPDPEGAIRILEQRVYNYHRELRTGDIGVYALASLMLSDKADIDGYITFLESVSGVDRKDALYWLYRINLIKGNDSKAISLMNEAYSIQLEDFKEVFNNSVSNALLKHKEEQLLAKKTRLAISYGLIASLILLIIGLAVIFEMWHRQHRIQEEAERKELERKLENYTSTLEDLSARLSEAIEGSHSAMDLGFDTMDRLCEAYYTSGHVKDKKLLSSFELLLMRFRKDKEYQAVFESKVDQIHGGLLSRMREQMPTLHEEDFILSSYVLSGLSYNSISVIMDTNKSNIYNKVTRLRQKIEKSAPEDKKQFLAALRKTNLSH